MMHGRGLFGSVKTLLSTLLGMAQTRLELLANELEEERHHLIRLQFYGLLTLFFFCMGMVLLTLLAIVAFWDTYRLLAIGLVAAAYLVIAAGLIVCVVRQVRHKPRLFSVSLAELAKDRAALESAE
jgi:uncharacterized membrane protein YqjE